MSSERDGWGLQGVAKEWRVGIEGLKEGKDREGENNCKDGKKRYDVMETCIAVGGWVCSFGKVGNEWDVCVCKWKFTKDKGIQRIFRRQQTCWSLRVCLGLLYCLVYKGEKKYSNVSASFLPIIPSSRNQPEKKRYIPCCVENIAWNIHRKDGKSYIQCLSQY